ncbi:hypothetical protein [Streptomyces sp. NPDC012888]|uniref:hypothetical protein n=1 Tax=Streptomyces sp. NPDC012888 TaxID=3364855 RepID=UPI00368F4735
MHRRARLTAALLLALGTPALATVAPTAFAQAAPAAPTVTCAVSAADGTDRVDVSGDGFTQGPAQLSSPGGGTTTFAVPDGGSFRIGNKPDDRYAVTQGGRTTACTGGTEPTAAPGTTYKAGLTAGWDAVRADCGARPPASANTGFTDGWNKGAATAREVFCQ